MKAIIIGYGSIGRNRASILQELGVSVKPVDLDEIDKIDDILKNEYFDFGLVCTPSNLHLEHSLKLASNKVSFFCEKPFYTNQIKLNSRDYLYRRDILNELEELVANNNLISMIACNWRFTDKVNQIPKETKFIKVRFGYNLAQWRNDGKHHQLYSANYSMGGGILMDAIHELDYLYYRFGKIKNIKLFSYKVSSMTVDTEDYVTGIIEFSSGTVATFELDYLSQVYQRYYEFLDKDEKLIKVNLIDNAEDKNNVDAYAKEMYRDEMKYFVDCVIHKKECMNDIIEARYLLDKIFSS